MDFLRSKVSDRKRRLFACVCCRRISHLLQAETLRNAVQVGEDFADGLLSGAQITPVREKVELLADEENHASFHYSNFHAYAVKWTIHENVNGLTAGQYASEALAFSVSGRGWSKKYVVALHVEQEKEIAILRDILGNPFRPLSITPDWLTPTVLSLAQAAYDNRSLPSGTLDNERLAILADALEDVGCENADILNHCRQPGEHVRGCWVVDAILEKE